MKAVQRPHSHLSPSESPEGLQPFSILHTQGGCAIGEWLSGISKADGSGENKWDPFRRRTRRRELSVDTAATGQVEKRNPPGGFLSNTQLTL